MGIKLIGAEYCHSSLGPKLFRARGRITSTRRILVLGFDIQPDGLYSVVGIDENERIVFKQENVSLPRLIRLLWEYRPRFLATDNIMELGGDESLVRKVLSMLPEETEVVQVTRNPNGGFMDLRALAALAGLKTEGKLTPLKTAYLVAVLAKRGYGARVIFTEEKTKIIISRARHGSAGGMSQVRYQRGVKAGILRATRVIKKLLDRHGFDYDLVFRKSGYGLESAVFIVYAPRHRLQGLLRNFRGRDIRIEIRPVYSGKILFETLRQDEETSRKHLIVGIDPGIVTGVAAIDLEGRPIFVYSRKGLDRAEIIELIKKHGEVVLIATDVTHVPDTVKKLASNLGVPLYAPSYPLSVEEKQALVAEIAQLLKNHKLNAHERDALAAAIKAFREYSSKLRQIESIASRYPAEISIENLKANVIRGLTIAEALEAEIERLLVEKQPKPIKQIRHARASKEKLLKNKATHDTDAAEKLEAARARIKVLESELERCHEHIKTLENELRLVKLESTEYLEDKLTEYRHRIKVLQQELEKTRQALAELEGEKKRIVEMLIEVSLGNLTVIPAIKSITRSSLAKLSTNSLFRAKRIVYIPVLGAPNASSLEALKKLKPVIIISLQNSNEVRESMLKATIPVVTAKEDDIIHCDENLGIAIVKSKLLEEAYLSYLEVLESTQEEHNRRKHYALDVDSLKRLIEAYRRSRLESSGEEYMEYTA